MTEHLLAPGLPRTDNFFTAGRSVSDTESAIIPCPLVRFFMGWICPATTSAYNLYAVVDFPTFHFICCHQHSLAFAAESLPATSALMRCGRQLELLACWPLQALSPSKGVPDHDSMKVCWRLGLRLSACRSNEHDCFRRIPMLQMPAGEMVETPGAALGPQVLCVTRVNFNNFHRRSEIPISLEDIK